KLAGVTVQIRARSTEEGHLFGSVTDKDIHHALTAAGWQLPARAVRLHAHIKEAGTSDVELHLHGEIVATGKVEGVPADAQGNQSTVVGAERREETPEEQAAGEPEVPAEASNV